MAPVADSTALRRARERLPGILEALEQDLLERRAAVRLALLAALAGEHTLLVGPPGTAKSALARRLHLAFREARYFERLLTRYTVPEELFGPLSIRALEEDRYERQTAGFLPQASIAFVDEVFKANSAILNSLLTLLNEREFDNGPRRERSPLISVIGATNAVPEDEVGEAFFDRFLVRVPVGPVGAASFARLLSLDGAAPRPPAEPLGEAERQALAAAARAVTLPAEVEALLAEARQRLAALELPVSDRRWVKIARLLAVAAASEGRGAVSIWDLWLLPWVTAPDAPRQAAVADWLAARLGVREAVSPPRLTRAVEALEKQVELEGTAEDLDYDEGGRLQFRSDLTDQVADAKGGATAPRLTHTRQRRYGASHVAARVRQVDDVLRRLGEGLAELAAWRADLAAYRKGALWLDLPLAERAESNLQATSDAVRALEERARRARRGFEALPRLASDPGHVPEPLGLELEAEPVAR